MRPPRGNPEIGRALYSGAHSLLQTGNVFPDKSAKIDPFLCLAALNRVQLIQLPKRRLARDSGDKLENFSGKSQSGALCLTLENSQ